MFCPPFLGGLRARQESGTLGQGIGADRGAEAAIGASAGWRQRNLCRSRGGGPLGVQEQTVSLWERGEQPVPQHAAVLTSAVAREYFAGQAAMKTVIDCVCSADRAIEKAKLLIERTDQGYSGWSARRRYSAG